MKRLGILGAAVVVLASCTAPPSRIDPAAAREFNDRAVSAAVAKPGARVCRRMQVGIAERDLVRGVVLEAKQGAVAVRIEFPGKYLHAINGVVVEPGARVWDSAQSWAPCL